MNILDQIVESKKKELKNLKEAIPLRQIEKTQLFGRKCISLKSRLEKPGSWGIIAEFKRKSPSRGIINDRHGVEEVTTAYTEAGAAALSVLTDSLYFGGSTEDLLCARLLNSCPVLRKDFIVDEYQLYEAKAMGADIILLIAACISPAKTKKLAALAHSLGMEVLLELHNEKELNQINEYVDFAGINNRNLKDFSVDINTSLQLGKNIPKSIIKISESGLNSAHSIVNLYREGFRGFLMGEAFMSKDNPGAECKKLIQTISSFIDIAE